MSRKITVGGGRRGGSNGGRRDGDDVRRNGGGDRGVAGHRGVTCHNGSHNGSGGCRRYVRVGNGGIRRSDSGNIMRGDGRDGGSCDGDSHRLVDGSSGARGGRSFHYNGSGSCGRGSSC